MQAADRCGLPDYVPFHAGDVYSANVPESVPDAPRKEDCIRRDLESQGLSAGG